MKHIFTWILIFTTCSSSSSVVKVFDKQNACYLEKYRILEILPVAAPHLKCEERKD